MTTHDKTANWWTHDWQYIADLGRAGCKDCGATMDEVLSTERPVRPSVPTLLGRVTRPKMDKILKDEVRDTSVPRPSSPWREGGAP